MNAHGTPIGRSPRRPPTSSGGSQQWTTRALLDWMAGAFGACDLDSPRLMAEMLLAHVLGCERLRLYMEADRPATPLERESLRDLVQRALAHEPVQYLVGEAWFFLLAFKVDRRALIPRPSTETILEHVLQHLRANPALAPGGELIIADICSGSGCVAIALAKNLPRARVIATDASSEALELARENIRRHGVGDRIELIEGDLLEPLERHRAGPRVDVLVSNPPYVPDHEWDQVAPNVRDYEPETSLRGGADGLRFVRPLVEGAANHLKPGGLVLIEIASSTAGAVLELARNQPGLQEPWIEDDLEGLPRVLVAQGARGQR